MKHLSCWSGGKDSTASIILAHEHGEPLDIILFSEVMFDKNISGELPEHIDFVKNKCIPLFKSWGYRTEILHSDKTFLDCFNHVIEKSEKNKGKIQGFPTPRMCKINDRCKTRPLDSYLRGLGEDYIKYVGIASDEPKRLARMGENQISLLYKYGYTEDGAYELCQMYGLISPVYEFATRNGCWFCPNAKDEELKRLRKNHRELWNKLLKLEEKQNLLIDKWNAITKTRIHDKEEQFYWEEQQMTIFDYME